MLVVWTSAASKRQFAVDLGRKEGGVFLCNFTTFFGCSIPWKRRQNAVFQPSSFSPKSLLLKLNDAYYALTN